MADAIDGDRARELPNADAVEGQSAQHLDRRYGVALVLGDEVRVGRSRPVLLDDSSRRLEAVEEDVVFVLRRHIEHRNRSGQHVVDGVLDTPPTARPRARIKRLGPKFALASRKVVDRIEVRRGVAVQARLGQERRDVVEIIGVVQKSWIPVVEAAPHVHGTLLSTLLERLSHRHPDQIDRAPHEWMHVRADGLRERRNPDARGERRRLVVVVDDLRFPVSIYARHHPRLDLIDHISVAVVVVPDVLLIQERRARDLERCAQVLVIPIRHHGLAIGVDAEPQHQDDVVEDGGDLRIGIARHEVVCELYRVLRVRYLGGVQPTVDVHDRFALFGERSRV